MVKAVPALTSEQNGKSSAPQRHAVKAPPTVLGVRQKANAPAGRPVRRRVHLRRTRRQRRIPTQLTNRAPFARRRDA